MADYKNLESSSGAVGSWSAWRFPIEPRPDQCGLFPVSPRDWLPEGHLVFFISETVDQLDLSELEKAYRGDGKGACLPSPDDAEGLVLRLQYGGVLVAEDCPSAGGSRVVPLPGHGRLSQSPDDLQSYNAQIAVDDTAHLIVAANVGQNAADVGSLIPTLDPDHEHRKETRSLACRRGLPIGRQLLEAGRQRGSCVHSLGTAGKQGRRTPTSPPLRA